MADGTVCYILKKYISEYFPEGSLLNLFDYRRKLYTPHRPSSSNRSTGVQTCTCKDSEIAPVFDTDYPYIARISSPEDRRDVFNRKLEWGKRLCENCHAYVKLRRRLQTSADEYAQVVIKYKGSTKIGMKFGVEFVVSSSLEIDATLLYCCWCNGACVGLLCVHGWGHGVNCPVHTC